MFSQALVSKLKHYAILKKPHLLQHYYELFILKYDYVFDFVEDV